MKELPKDRLKPIRNKVKKYFFLTQIAMCLSLESFGTLANRTNLKRRNLSMWTLYPEGGRVVTLSLIMGYAYVGQKELFYSGEILQTE